MKHPLPMSQRDYHRLQDRCAEAVLIAENIFRGLHIACRITNDLGNSRKVEMRKKRDQSKCGGARALTEANGQIFSHMEAINSGVFKGYPYNRAAAIKVAGMLVGVHSGRVFNEEKDQAYVFCAYIDSLTLEDDERIYPEPELVVEVLPNPVENTPFDKLLEVIEGEVVSEGKPKSFTEARAAVRAVDEIFKGPRPGDFGYDDPTELNEDESVEARSLNFPSAASLIEDVQKKELPPLRSLMGSAPNLTSIDEYDGE